jgi:hypothetical protein
MMFFAVMTVALFFRTLGTVSSLMMMMMMWMGGTAFVVMLAPSWGILVEREAVTMWVF